MKSPALLTLCLLAGALGANAQAPAPPPAVPLGSLTLEDVVQMTKSGVSEEVIAAKIKRAGRAFDLSGAEIRELKRAGVGDALIKILLDPSQPYVPPAAPAAAPAVSAPRKPLDPIVEKLPAEIGAFAATDEDEEEFMRLELKTLTGGKATGMLKAVKKRGAKGSLIGKAAKSQLPAGPVVLFVRLPEKTGIEDLVLLELETKKDRREVTMADPEKAVFPIETVHQFQSRQLDQKLYRIETTAPLKKGEYFLYLLGTGEGEKGILGKGYEFGITSSQPSP